MRNYRLGGHEPASAAVLHRLILEICHDRYFESRDGGCAHVETRSLFNCDLFGYQLIPKSPNYLECWLILSRLDYLR